jgi:hypothetical protein
VSARVSAWPAGLAGLEEREMVFNGFSSRLRSATLTPNDLAVLGGEDEF